MTDEGVQFPNYQPPDPPGLPVADRKQHGPLVKMMNKMLPKKLKPRLMGRAKGVQADQNVHVKHKKVKFY